MDEHDVSVVYIDLVLSGVLAASTPRRVRILHALAATCRTLCTRVRSSMRVWLHPWSPTPPPILAWALRGGRLHEQLIAELDLMEFVSRFTEDPVTRAVAGGFALNRLLARSAPGCGGLPWSDGDIDLFVKLPDGADDPFCDGIEPVLDEIEAFFGARGYKIYGDLGAAAEYDKYGMGILQSVPDYPESLGGAVAFNDSELAVAIEEWLAEHAGVDSDLAACAAVLHVSAACPSLSC